MGYINKTVFLNYLSCPTLGWMSKRGMLPRLEGLNNELLTLEGNNVHKLSWQLFPDAVNAQKKYLSDSAAYTQELLQNPENKTFVEASFISNGFSVRTDTLQRLDDNTWHLFEVKSGGKYKVKYVQDMTFSAMVLKKSGINVTKASLMHLANGYRLGMDSSALFKTLDCSEKVELRLGEYLNISDKAFEELESEKMPEPYLKRSCKNCPVFDNCMGKDIKNHIFDLPRLSVPAIEELIALGADTIDKVPEGFELTEQQQIVKNCVLSGKTYISPNLKPELDNLKEPFYYLDFESITTIMPLFPDIAPHTQLLTQFSIDKSSEIGKVDEHFEYIGDHKKDCRREIAEKLVECLGEEGSIITYANFERIAISRLAGLFPDLCDALNKIAERVVDFEIILRKNYYDINFHGRSSIKKVLPAIVPEMNYDSLEIGEGGDAAAAFAFMAMGLYDEEKIAETKKNLLKYCAQDTLAMVKIHSFLAEIVNNIS
ncbi:MAG: DUF2779 domain-containing protein [Endomicrobia bacterium]|nr:DUF2779 domain-containing protein [Endomicrobiia bacterium]MCL2506439.1 DUF2779 domain-containing protein [Endomicrobiia bacterium]